MLRRRQRQFAKYYQDISIMDTRCVQNVYGQYTKEEENKKIAAEEGTELVIMEWDQKSVLNSMIGYKDKDFFSWKRVREILFVVNFKNLFWFTFWVD